MTHTHAHTHLSVIRQHRNIS